MTTKDIFKGIEGLSLPQYCGIPTPCAHIVCGFPGVGKTTFVANSPNKKLVMDSDSSNFDKLEFPYNYIEHITNNLDKATIIFASTHKSFLDRLWLIGAPYTIVVPSIDRKQEFFENYKKRGNTKEFIELLDKNWENWIQHIIDNYDNVVVLSKGFIGDLLLK